MGGPRAHLGYRPHLDGLRAVAVLLVVAYHAGFTVISGGFVGVDVFFVLSGYLITRLLVAELVEHGRLQLPRFYARRMRRLLPASALALGGAVFASVHLLDRAQQLAVADDVRWSALWSANWRFVQSRIDYFAPGDVPSPVVHYWSLAVEEQFYVVWPALLFGLWWLLARRAGRPTIALAAAIAGLAAASLVASVVLPATATTYYGTHTRAYQLLAGALLALVLEARVAGDPTRWTRTRAATAALAGLAVIGVVATQLDAGSRYPGWSAVAVTAGTVLVLAALELGSPGPVHRVLGAPAPAAVGRVSYSLYLWHWPVLVLAPLLAVRWQREWIDDRPVVFLAMGGLAVASYLAFERPIRFRLAPGARPAAVVVAGLALTAVVAVPAAQRLLPSDRDERIALAAVRDLSRPGPCPYFPRDWPSPDRAEVCTWREGGDRSILLVGDSHAQMWLPAVEHLAERYDLTVYRVTRGGCPVNDILVYHLDDIDGSKVPDHDCSAWRASLYRRAVADLDPDVVLASTRSHVLGIKDGDRYVVPRDVEHQAVWRDGFVRSLDWLTAGSGTVVVSEILPTLPERVPACLAEHGLSTRACDWPVTVDRRVGVFNQEIRALPGTVPDVVTIDLTPLACPDGRCSAMAGDVVVHRDDNHLSRSYVATLGDAFEDVLRKAGIVFGQSTKSNAATAAQAQ